VIESFVRRPVNEPHGIIVTTTAAGEPASVQQRRVVEIQDRWRIDDEWWRERPISRLYHVLLVEGGFRLTVYLDLLSGEWFEQSAGKVRTGKPLERRQASRTRTWVAERV